jgi:hypothetical protein
VFSVFFVARNAGVHPARIYGPASVSLAPGPQHPLFWMNSARIMGLAWVVYPAGVGPASHSTWSTYPVFFYRAGTNGFSVSAF